MSQQEAGQQGSQMVCEIYHLDDEEEADCQVELNWVEVEKDAACQEEVDKGNTAGKPAGAAQGNGGQTSIPVPSYILSPDYKSLLHEDLPPVTYEGKTLTVGSSEWISTMVNVIIPDANDGTWGYGQGGSFSPHNKHGSGNYVWVRILHEVSRYGYSTTLRDGAAELAFLVRQQTDSCNRAKQYKDEQQRIAAGEPHSGRNGISISRFPGNYDDFYDPNPPPVTLAQLQAAALYWMYQAGGLGSTGGNCGEEGQSYHHPRCIKEIRLEMVGIAIRFGGGGSRCRHRGGADPVRWVTQRLGLNYARAGCSQ